MSIVHDVRIDIEPNELVNSVERRRRRRRRRRSRNVALRDGSHQGKFMLSRESQESLLFPRSQHRFQSPIGPELEEEEYDQESGELNLNYEGEDRKLACRICQFTFDEISDDDECEDIIIELGCNCKGDLAAVHKDCAETWFQIRGNTICEICCATAQNFVLEQENELNYVIDVAGATSEASDDSLVDRNANWGHLGRFVLIMLVISAMGISYYLHLKHDH